MRAFAIAAALVLVLVGAPASQAVVSPASDPTGLLLRADDDGNTTLLLGVEDVPGGVVTHTRLSPTIQQTAGYVREFGTYTRAYAGFDGAPTVAAGVYVVSIASDPVAVRVPLLLVESVGSTNEATTELVAAANRLLIMGGNGLPFFEELVLPELSDHFGANPVEERFSTYRDHPTLYVWTTHRSGVAGDVWAGHYVARTGSFVSDGAGGVSSARADAEFGVASRSGGVTTRVAGVYIDNAYESVPGNQRDHVVVGVVGAGIRTPVAGLDLSDERSGAPLAEAPRDQRTRAAFGAYVAGGFFPLVGAQTTQTMRASERGDDVTRVTSVGAYTLDGRFVPVAGMRYASNTGTLLDTVGALLGGPGDPAPGDFSIDVGVFPEDEFVPVAGFVHRSHFREARYAYATLLAAGVYTPFGFSPVAVVTYDGSTTLLDWSFRLVGGTADHEEWMIATGTMATGTYVPLVGVEGVGRAPLQGRAEGVDLRVGVFAGSYAAFVPLASVAYDGDRSVLEHALAWTFGGTLGSDSGAFGARVGTYATGGYVGLAGVEYASEGPGSANNETLLTAGTFLGDEYVPVAGVLFAGDDTLVGSLNAAGDVNDDDRVRFYVGVFVDGAFVPLLLVESSGSGVMVLPFPPAP